MRADERLNFDVAPADVEIINAKIKNNEAKLLEKPSNSKRVYEVVLKEQKIIVAYNLNLKHVSTVIDREKYYENLSKKTGVVYA